MNELELTPNTIIIGEKEYTAALDLIIARAENDLLIFDQDLSRGDYASLQRFGLIQGFLNKNATTKLTIILQSAEFFTTLCPRLFELLETYGHKITVYQTNDAAKVAKDCFVIADKRHYLRRFHIDQARFKFAFDDEVETANLLMRFDELLEETSETVSATKLGL
jgi:hypothetical protein